MSTNADDFSIRYKRIPEIVVENKPLGRHVKHDSRSLRYAAPEGDLGALVHVDHSSRIDVLDQGNTGSCTGNATIGALGADPFYATLKSQIDSGLILNEAEAVRVYSRATQLDSYDGAYPPDDTGSDGLSAAKAAKEFGLISGYTHALSLNAALTALQVTPVITGVNWYSGFDNPGMGGLVKLGGQVRGGHEFVVVGNGTAQDFGLSDLPASTRVVKARNSWGIAWGVQGYFFFTEEDWGTLLGEDGDVTIFTPLSQPAPTPTPTPTPVPTPTPDDGVTKVFTSSEADVINSWAESPHVWSKATKAAKAWRAADSQ